MKIRSFAPIIAIGFTAGLTTVVFTTGCGQSTHSHAAAKYYCPMHPTVVSDKSGDCPICSMRLVPITGDKAPPPKPDEHAGHSQESSVPGLAIVSITPAARERMGLKFGTVEKRKLAKEIRTSARLVADETRQHHVTVKTEGWIGQLFVAVTGQEVKRGDPLLTLYSPELVSAQEEYLIALKAKAIPGGESLLAAARRRLELWDVTEEQIAQLENTGQAQKYLTFHSHLTGVVFARSVLPGHKVMPDEPLMTIADLSVVWADADIYQSDLLFVKGGMPVEVTVGDKTFAGKITFVSPTLDPATRTMKARLEIPNSELLLKPEMYGTARLAYELGERLAIPEAAVMRTGDHTYAFKEAGDHQIVPVKITIGARCTGWYEVVAGLNEGDQVVTSANFLVDSESSLKAVLAGMSGGGHAH